MGEYMCSTSVMLGLFGQYAKPRKAFCETYEESIKRTAAVGRQLMAARKAAGISRKELADFLGVCHDYVMNVENGKSIPTVSYIVGFCVCINHNAPDDKNIFPGELLGIYPKEPGKNAAAIVSGKTDEEKGGE